MKRRIIENEADALECLASVSESGLNRTQWAREHCVDGRSLGAWKRRLERPGANRAPVQLVELVADSVPGHTKPRSTYLVHRGSFSVEVGDDFNEVSLRRLLRLVAQC